MEVNMIRTYTLSIPMISLCFASIQAMDPNTNREIIERLASDILNNDIIRVQTTLESNPELAHGRSKGSSPMLMIAAESKTPEMVKLLLKYGPDVDANDKHDTTPLMIAAYCGQRGSVRLLLEAGADTNLKNKDGDTALIDTIRSDIQLLEHGVYVDEQNNDYATVPLALMEAVTCEKQEIITLLLESGADPTIRDNKGRTAADIARSKRNKDLAEFIESWQSKNIKGAED